MVTSETRLNQNRLYQEAALITKFIRSLKLEASRLSNFILNRADDRFFQERS